MVHIYEFVLMDGCRRHIEKYNIYPLHCQPFIGACMVAQPYCSVVGDERWRGRFFLLATLENVVQTFANTMGVLYN